MRPGTVRRICQGSRNDIETAVRRRASRAECVKDQAAEAADDAWSLQEVVRRAVAILTLALPRGAGPRRVATVASAGGRHRAGENRRENRP